MLRKIKTALWLRYQRSSLFMFEMLRLQDYGRFEAVICLLAHRVCGTPIYWYPKRKREALRKEREARCVA